ncbi:MAG TPA: ATP-binding protein [Gemmatimonadaceae bacterium]
MIQRSNPAPGGRSSVGVLAPTGRDGPLALQVLAKHGIPAHVCGDMDDVVRGVSDGVGALLIAEEALGPGDRAELVAALEQQPVWSDVPVVLLIASGTSSGALNAGVQQVMRRGNVTLLERPVRVATLTSALDAALRARTRQYEIRDAIVERARMAETERVLRGEAEDANMAKMQFLATMSHELRTPLNAIGGHVQLIQLGILGPVTPKQHEALARVRRAEAHLLGLINDVLNFAKIEAGHVTFDVTPTTIGELFDGMDALIEPQVKAKGLTYTRRRDCDPVSIMADLDKARQVLLNLLSNAVKFTQPGGHIAVVCHQAGGTVKIDVTDTGIGVPPEALASIFEPFIQVRPDYTAKHEGTGLGLAISRDLARAMKGDLTARSEVGKGSTFTLTLPSAMGADGQ